MSNPNSIIRVLLVDDHPLVLDGIQARLESVAGIVVVGQANDGQQALACAAQLDPDVVLMDVSMPVMNGLEAVRCFRTQFPAIRVLMLSMHDNREYIMQVMQAGARGYILKDVSSEELISAIETVAIGNSYFSHSASQALFSAPQALLPDPASHSLTPREVVVLKRLAEGKSNKAIANLLNISVRTVETHRQNIKNKLDIQTAAGLVRYAIEQGLVDRP